MTSLRNRHIATLKNVRLTPMNGDYIANLIDDLEAMTDAEYEAEVAAEAERERVRQHVAGMFERLARGECTREEAEVAGRI